ncbi:uncharacterized protein LOC112344280 [Selaginella moellendorffii]|uniref:uncharacterized protein LOC112344280 n=1 Tax=Selaginella moellendorffii TaxID=88036 RepID=UPI000D1CF67A|nr:uncharacterized protein LOC112344280 [Selaginella moellendorffii]|eukprot:XP_024524438.1 uncharacterized protein LOC112344280 [Selaginella moellendorffii]
MAATLATAGSHSLLKAKLGSSPSPELLGVFKRFDATAAARLGSRGAAVARSSSSESVQSVTKKKKKKLPDAAWPVLFYRDWVEKYGSSKFHGEEEDEDEVVRVGSSSDGDSPSRQNLNGSSSGDEQSKTTGGKI